MRKSRSILLAGFALMAPAAACSFVLDADRLERGRPATGDANVTVVGEDAPAPSDAASGEPAPAATSCSDDTPFASIVAVSTSLPKEMRAASATLSLDERTAFIAVFLQETQATIVEATRADPTAPFVMTPNKVPNGVDPSLTFDGLSLYYVMSSGTPIPLVAVATRSQPTGPFENTQQVPINASTIRSPHYLSSEGILYVALSKDTETAPTIYATGTGRADELVLFGSDSVAGTYPNLTLDGATMYFDVQGDIMMAKRVGGPTEFSQPTLVASVSTLGEETAPWISADRCRLYFFRDSAFMMAERKP